MTLIVAIDGPAGTGKSSLAKMLSKQLNFIYVDTGAIYRALALLVDSYQIDAADVDQVLTLIPHICVVCDKVEQRAKVTVDNKPVDKELRSEKISRLASIVSQHKRVREALLPIQRNLVKQIEGGAIFEGRDVGTVVFPKAQLKIFVTANSQTRALRRYEELKDSTTSTYDEILQAIKNRDERDEQRVNAPMQKASDAHVIDTSSMTLEQVIETALNLIRNTPQNLPKGSSLW